MPNLDRMHDCLNVCWGEALLAFPQGTPKATLVKGLWCNPSQAVQRRPWTREKGTLTTGSLWYSYERDTTLDGHDFMRLHGHPALIDVGPLTEKDLKELGGEGFSAPIVSVFVAALYYLPWADWWQQQESS
jgi:hypothetical protein